MGFIGNVKARVKRWADGAPDETPVLQGEIDDEPITQPSIMTPGASAPASHFEASRALIDSFDEDKEGAIDRFKRFFALAIAVVMPLIAIVAVSNEVGLYFSGGRAFTFSDAWTVSMYGLAWACEAVLAALTYAMGALLQRKTLDRGNWTRFAFLLLLWLLFDIGSGLAQWVIAVQVLHASDTWTVRMIFLRVAMVSLLDLACVVIFAAFRGKSLKKFLDTQRQKAEAIRAINDSELEIERAQQEAVMRRDAERQYLEGRQARERVIVQFEGMMGQALLNQANRMFSGSQDENRQLRG